MSVELLQTISLVSYCLAATLFVLSVALFFLLDVPKLYGDISGKNARKAIESIRQQNETSGDKAYKPSPVNAKRGKVTEKISSSGKLQKHNSGIGVNVGTQDLNIDVNAQIMHNTNSNATTVLNETAAETTVLDGNETLESFAAETTVLPQTAGETTVLNTFETQQESSQNANEKTDVFTVEVNMGFIGSTEIIR